MRVIVCSTKNYEQNYLIEANQQKHDLHFIPDGISLDLDEVNGFTCICCFVTDHLNQKIIAKLATKGIKLIALRSAGYDHVDLATAKAHKITVVRVPKYSPQAVAEFAVGLILVLSRKILKAYQQGLEYNFLLEGLIGFNLYQKTVGII